MSPKHSCTASWIINAAVFRGGRPREMTRSWGAYVSWAWFPAGGSWSLRLCLWRLYRDPNALFYLLLLPHCHEISNFLPSWCVFLATDLKAMEPADYGLTTLNLWAETNLFFLKLSFWVFYNAKLSDTAGQFFWWKDLIRGNSKR